MDRRRFLELLGSGALGAAAASTFDLEKLLWVPKPMVTVPAMPPTIVSTAASVPIYEVFRKGDIFTIAGKYALNPLTLEPTDRLQEFEIIKVVNGVPPLAAIYPGGLWRGWRG